MKASEREREILRILASFQHPTDPSLWLSHEGYVSLDYFTRECRAIECCYKVWVGTRKKGCYVPAKSIIYHNVTRIQAYTQLMYALNACKQEVRWGLAYCDFSTREIEEEERREQ